MNAHLHRFMFVLDLFVSFFLRMSSECVGDEFDRSVDCIGIKFLCLYLDGEGDEWKGNGYLCLMCAMSVGILLWKISENYNEFYLI